MARTVVAGALLAGLVAIPSGPASAQTARPLRVHAGVHRPAARLAGPARPLTIRRTALRRPALVVRRGGEPEGDNFVFRDWNDTRLTRWGPFRLGGDVFYGDGRGDPITRGNSTLGQIAGYGPARGGFGGPHFDSVGGFHPGPGPDAAEDDDYASGSISTPDYEVVVPHYPGVKARVAALNAGVVPANGVLARSGRIARPLVIRASTATLPVPTASSDDEGDAEAPPARAATSEDIFPGLDLGEGLF